MAEVITQKIIYKPVEDDLQAVIAEISAIADKTPENALEQAAVVRYSELAETPKPNTS